MHGMRSLIIHNARYAVPNYTATRATRAARATRATRAVVPAATSHPADMRKASDMRRGQHWPPPHRRLLIGRLHHSLDLDHPHICLADPWQATLERRRRENLVRGYGPVGFVPPQRVQPEGGDGGRPAEAGLCSVNGKPIFAQAPAGSMKAARSGPKICSR